ncbi:MAG: WecB/TagA/CpsF family glycosyltransferase [Candidatus Omnitrophica bacterium]|nr:WecB/TagA/CpsF family glycosyltransferase [Candidatus Omnitrophota bacterium]
MRIGFDATSLCRQITGIESYTLILLQNLLRLDGNNEYVIFFRKEIHPLLLGFERKAKFIVCPIDNQIFCEQIWLPYIANREKVDIMHFPAFPPGILTSRKFVFTIHDATIWKYPNTLSWKGKLYFRPLTILGARRAQKIITVSESSKNDIVGYVRREPGEIINCQEAVSPVFESLADEKMLQAIENKYDLPKKFILSVNSIEPRKNICRLLEAYKIFKEENKSLSHKLVLVGRRAWGNDAVIKKIKELEINNDIVFTGYVSNAELVAIYKLADVFVCPSLYEGFGLPPLEAMACGVSVIASNIPVFSEMLSDSAIFIDPYNPEDISRAMQKVIIQPEVKETLSKKGLERYKMFSWGKVVEKTIYAYKLSFLSPRVSILGIWIDNVTMADALNEVEQYIKIPGYAYIVTPNVHHLVLLQKDEEFKDIYHNASLVLPDGMPLLWAAKFLGTPLKEKISGSDLFPRLCAIAADKGYKLFFLGGREGAAEKAAGVLRAKYPEIQIVGFYSPPLGFENDIFENTKIVNMIRSANPDFLFVGLGAPKQEKWIYRHKEQYQVPVSIGIGVSFEFIAGIVKRAPVWMQKKGLEWFWRMMMEPKRLWKRYLIDGVGFFLYILKQKVKGRN